MPYLKLLSYLFTQGFPTQGGENTATHVYRRLFINLALGEPQFALGANEKELFDVATVILQEDQGVFLTFHNEGTEGKILGTWEIPAHGIDANRLEALRQCMRSVVNASRDEQFNLLQAPLLHLGCELD